MRGWTLKTTKPSNEISNVRRTDSMSGKERKKQTDYQDVMLSLIPIKDESKGKALLEEYVRSDWDSKHGGALIRLEKTVQEDKERYEQSVSELKRLETKKSKTARYVDAASGTKDDFRGFKDWQFKHQLNYVIAYGLGFTVLTASGFTVFTNLMATAEPVFTENPVIPAIMSILLPACSFPIKHFYSLLPSGKAKQRYAMGVYATSAVLLALWAALFAMSFSGLTEGFSLDMLDVSEGHSFLDKLYVFVHMSAEIAAGSALMIMGESVSLLYCPNMYRESLEFIEIEKAVKQQKESHEPISKQYDESLAEYTELKASRACAIHEATAKFVKLYHQYHFKPSD